MVGLFLVLALLAGFAGMVVVRLLPPGWLGLVVLAGMGGALVMLGLMAASKWRARRLNEDFRRSPGQVLRGLGSAYRAYFLSGSLLPAFTLTVLVGVVLLLAGPQDYAAAFLGAVAGAGTAAFLGAMQGVFPSSRGFRETLALCWKRIPGWRGIPKTQLADRARRLGADKTLRRDDHLPRRASFERTADEQRSDGGSGTGRRRLGPGWPGSGLNSTIASLAAFFGRVGSFLASSLLLAKRYRRVADEDLRSADPALPGLTRVLDRQRSGGGGRAPKLVASGWGLPLRDVLGRTLAVVLLTALLLPVMWLATRLLPPPGGLAMADQLRRLAYSRQAEEGAPGSMRRGRSDSETASSAGRSGDSSRGDEAESGSGDSVSRDGGRDRSGQESGRSDRNAGDGREDPTSAGSREPQDRERAGRSGEDDPASQDGRRPGETDRQDSPQQERQPESGQNPSRNEGETSGSGDQGTRSEGAQEGPGGRGPGQAGDESAPSSEDSGAEDSAGGGQGQARESSEPGQGSSGQAESGQEGGSQGQDQGQGQGQGQGTSGGASRDSRGEGYGRGGNDPEMDFEQPLVEVPELRPDEAVELDLPPLDEAGEPGDEPDQRLSGERPPPAAASRDRSASEADRRPQEEASSQRLPNWIRALWNRLSPSEEPAQTVPREPRRRPDPPDKPDTKEQP